MAATANTSANPWEGLRAFSEKAERSLLQQRRALVPQFIQMDREAAGNPADIAMCARVIAAAKEDFGEFENLMTFREVNELFCRGALHFGRST